MVCFLTSYLHQPPLQLQFCWRLGLYQQGFAPHRKAKKMEFGIWQPSSFGGIVYSSSLSAGWSKTIGQMVWKRCKRIRWQRTQKCMKTSSGLLNPGECILWMRILKSIIYVCRPLQFLWRDPLFKVHSHLPPLWFSKKRCKCCFGYIFKLYIDFWLYIDFLQFKNLSLWALSLYRIVWS